MNPNPFNSLDSNPKFGNRDTTIYKRFTTPSGVKYYVGHTQPSRGSQFTSVNPGSANVEFDYQRPAGQGRDSTIENEILQHYRQQPDSQGKTGYTFTGTDLSSPMNNPTGNLKPGQGQSISNFYDTNLPSKDVTMANPQALKKNIAQKMA